MYDHITTVFMYRHTRQLVWLPVGQQTPMKEARKCSWVLQTSSLILNLNNEILRCCAMRIASKLVKWLMIATKNNQSLSESTNECSKHSIMIVMYSTVKREFNLVFIIGLLAPHVMHPTHTTGTSIGSWCTGRKTDCRCQFPPPPHRPKRQSVTCQSASRSVNSPAALSSASPPDGVKWCKTNALNRPVCNHNRWWKKHRRIRNIRDRIKCKHVSIASEGWHQTKQII